MLRTLLVGVLLRSAEEGLMADKVVARITDKLYGPTHTHKLQRGDLATITLKGGFEYLAEYAGHGKWLVFGYDESVEAERIIEMIAPVPLYANGSVEVVED